MSGHIKAINVESFRGIKNLCLEDLAPINILTGDNNSGKTSVLEVIESLDAPGNINMWKALTRRERLMPVGFGISIYEALLNLFHVDEEKRMLSYKVKFSDGEEKRIMLRGHLEEDSLTMKEIRELDGMFYGGEDEEIEENSLFDLEKLKLEAYVDDELVLENVCYDMGRKTVKDGIGSNIHLADVTYISPVRHAEGTVFLNSVLDNPELYEQMLQVLQEFDPGIISINVDTVNEKYRRGRVYKILSKEHNKALPLNVYGDGMKKAILLMSAVIRTQGGILLLDEFETAIHTTAMEKTFQWILKTCMKLDVQLFLTTHSEEAIDKVLKCCPELQDMIKVFTLYKQKDETVVRALNAKKAIEIKDEMGIELR